MRITFDKFFITAMDRFVWFILLIVTTHLVTEFTKINGYPRERRSIPMNQSVFLNAIDIPFWPQTPNNNLDFLPMVNTNTNSNTEEKTPGFSLRPFIDSIFEIPVSAMNAVNRFVQRLTSTLSMNPTTGSYTYGSPNGGYPQKSTTMKEKSS